CWFSAVCRRRWSCCLRLWAAGFWRYDAVLARALCRHLRSSWSPCVFLEKLSLPLHLFRVSRHASNPSPIAQAFGRTLIRRGAPDGFVGGFAQGGMGGRGLLGWLRIGSGRDRKSTRLNSSHVKISYAVFCLKK